MIIIHVLFYIFFRLCLDHISSEVLRLGHVYDPLCNCLKHVIYRVSTEYNFYVWFYSIMTYF